MRVRILLRLPPKKQLFVRKAAFFMIYFKFPDFPLTPEYSVVYLCVCQNEVIPWKILNTLCSSMPHAIPTCSRRTLASWPTRANSVPRIFHRTWMNSRHRCCANGQPCPRIPPSIRPSRSATACAACTLIRTQMPRLPLLCLPN